MFFAATQEFLVRAGMDQFRNQNHLPFIGLIFLVTFAGFLLARAVFFEILLVVRLSHVAVRAACVVSFGYIVIGGRHRGCRIRYVRFGQPLPFYGGRLGLRGVLVEPVAGNWG